MVFIVKNVDTGLDESACFALRAKQYGRYYRNIPATDFSDEFDAARAEDGSRIAHLFGVLREDSLVGTCRLIRTFDASRSGCKSEVGELFDFDWGQVAELTGIPLQELKVGELGKFAVAEPEDSRTIKWLLLTSAGKLAVELGIQIVLAIMPPAVERAAKSAGARFHRLAGVGLRRDDVSRQRYLLRYHDYFLPMFRKAGMEIDCERLDIAEPMVLEMLMSGASDGPVLWWIQSAELSASLLPPEHRSAS